MQYYKLIVSYRGNNYYGWQKQCTVPTVQGAIENALKELIPGKDGPGVWGASRTDARVHAQGQCVLVRIPYDRPQEEIIADFNSVLPPDIRVTDAEIAGSKFKVIHHARNKEYRYFFANRDHPDAIDQALVANVSGKLDFALMQQAAKLFVGEHDFSNYCYRGQHANSSVRRVLEADLIENDSYMIGCLQPKCYVFRVRGEGFLKQMVRIMVGVLWEVGKGNVSLEEVQESLQTGSKLKLGHVAPAEGLYLTEIVYPPRNRGPRERQ